MKRYLVIMLTIIISAIGFPGYSLADTLPEKIEWISCSDIMNQGNANSSRGVVSSDGRYIAFASYARLTMEDADSYSDIYLRDRLTGKLELVSLSSNGVKGNLNSFHPAISNDGRYVAFYSNSTNFFDGAEYGVYVRDRVEGKTELVSKSSNGVIGNQMSYESTISGDGRYIAFTSQANNLVNVKTFGPQIYIHDQVTGNTELVSVSSRGEAGFGDSKHPSISKDGRFVAFVSYANNLVEGDTNAAWDAFVRDRSTGKTIRVSVSSNGAESKQPIGYAVQGVRYTSISPDGKYVAFYSLASNLTNINTNGKWNVFLHNISASQTELVSVTQNGLGINDNFPPMDPMANYISSDGRFVVLQINSAIITDGNNDLSNGIFLWDRYKGTTEKINLSTYNGKQAVGATPSISPNGRYLVFQTSINGLVKEDNNWGLDVYLTDFGDIKELDTIAPDTTAKLTGIQGENNWYIDSVYVTLNPGDNPEGSGIAKTEYSLDGVNWNIYTTPILINLDGINKVYYRSIDNAGNQEEVNVQEVKIDKTAPIIITNIQKELVIDRFGNFEIKNRAEDNTSGILALETTLDGKLINNEEALNLENLAFGSHIMIINAIDAVGNRSQEVINFTITTSMETLTKLLEKYYNDNLIDNKGIYQSLKVKVANNSLTAFINAVEAQKGKHIDSTAGDVLLEYAEWLKNNL